MSEPIPTDESPASAPQAVSELIRLGHQLRKAREDRGLSLQDLADQLHMGHAQLEALESAEVARLPEKVFVVAQARRVATALGLEADPLIEGLRRADFASSPRPSRPDPLPVQPSRSLGPTEPGSSGSRRHPLPGWILAGAGGLALVAAAALAWSHFRETPSPAPVSSARPPTPDPAGAVPPPKPSAAAPDTQRKDARPPVVAALQLSSPQGSWISVRTASGTSLFVGSLKGTRSFPLGQGLQVLAGRPDLVTARIDSGPTRPLGSIDQVIWRRFTSPSAAAR